MKKSIWTTSMAATAAASMLALTACGGTAEEEDAQPAPSQTASEASAAPSTSSESSNMDMGMDHGSGGMAGHNPEGGPPPEGIETAADPTYPIDSTAVLTADHMPGMAGSEATISGAFDTTAYSVSYTPTDGGEPVVDHKWVVHEELENPGEAPLPEGTEVVLNADHMPGMNGAEATIESSTEETVYMVDVEMDGMEMTNHKWFVESELQPAQ
ncbi:YdhK family protein [Kocuria palustris]|uniref:YdhK family protein n=1 Tax=Kocuria palustris TaxID=71999 RepID=UPI0023019C83|nr:YdhK family protein [Kocuria palustris]